MDINNHIKKGLVFGIILLFIGSNILPIIRGDNKTINNNENYLSKDKNDMNAQFIITSHPARQNEIDQLKNLYGVFDKNRNYNVIYDGHGTGLVPPTEKDDEMIGSLLIIDKITSPVLLFDSYE